MNLWVDDFRNPPETEQWEWAKTYQLALALLCVKLDSYQVVSFDHDLGEEKTGYDLLCDIERWVHSGLVRYLPELQVHSANPVGYAKMIRVIDSINRYFTPIQAPYTTLVPEEKRI